MHAMAQLAEIERLQQVAAAASNAVRGRARAARGASGARCGVTRRSDRGRCGLAQIRARAAPPRRSRRTRSVPPPFRARQAARRFGETARADGWLTENGVVKRRLVDEHSTARETAMRMRGEARRQFTARCSRLRAKRRLASSVKALRYAGDVDAYHHRAHLPPSSPPCLSPAQPCLSSPSYPPSPLPPSTPPMPRPRCANVRDRSMMTSLEPVFSCPLPKLQQYIIHNIVLSLSASHFQGPLLSRS